VKEVIEAGTNGASQKSTGGKTHDATDEAEEDGKQNHAN
jgi:hypothetical protein